MTSSAARLCPTLLLTLPSRFYTARKCRAVAVHHLLKGFKARCSDTCSVRTGSRAQKIFCLGEASCIRGRVTICLRQGALSCLHHSDDQIEPSDAQHRRETHVPQASFEGSTKDYNDRDARRLCRMIDDLYRINPHKF